MDVVITAGTSLYRGSDSNQFEFRVNHAMWFAETTDVAITYGSNIHLFDVSKNVNLLDVSSPLFHSDYLTKVNRAYTNDNGADVRKDLALTAFGLPDLNTQMYVLRGNGICRHDNMYHDPQPGTESAGVFNEVKRRTAYFGNLHRFSSPVTFASGEVLHYDYTAARALQEL